MRHQESFRLATWLRVDLPVTAEAVSAARHRLREFDAIDDELRPDLELLVTELVANVVRHSGLDASETLNLQVATLPGYVWAEVSDTGRPLPEIELPIEPPTSPAEAGLGLLLLDRVADRWGTLPGSGAHVWFELEGHRKLSP